MAKRKRVWTQAQKKAFAARMKAARAAKGRLVKGRGRKHATKRGKTVRVIKRRRSRKVNPSPKGFMLMAKRGDTRLYYDGIHFSSKGKAEIFKYRNAVVAKARELMKKFPILRSYQLYAKVV